MGTVSRRSFVIGAGAVGLGLGKAREYLLLSKRTRQVFETDAVTAWKPSKRPA